MSGFESIICMAAKKKGKQQDGVKIDERKLGITLFICEGNLTYTEEMIHEQQTVLPTETVATLFESEEIAYQRYAGLEARVAPLRQLVVHVVFSVDATNIVGMPFNKFNSIQFNYPHSIMAPSHDLEAHKTMLTAFFRQCVPLLDKNGKVYVVLKKNYPYGKSKIVPKDLDEMAKINAKGWDIGGCAMSAGLNGHSWFNFDFGGHQRYKPTKGFGKSPASTWITGQSFMHVFQVDRASEELDKKLKM